MRSIKLILITCQLAIVYSNNNDITTSSIDYSYTIWRDFYPDIEGVGSNFEPLHPIHEGMIPDLYHGCRRIGTTYREADVGWEREERSDCLERDGLSYRINDYVNDQYLWTKKSDKYDIRCQYTGCSNVSDYSISMNGWFRHDSYTKSASFQEEFSMMGLGHMHNPGEKPRASLVPFIDKEEGGRYWPLPSGDSWDPPSAFFTDPFPGVNFKSTAEDGGVHLGKSPSVLGKTLSNLMDVRVQLFDDNDQQLPCYNEDTGVQDEVVAAVCHLDTSSTRYTELKNSGTCPVLDSHEAWHASAGYNLNAADSHIDVHCLSNARHYHRSLMHKSNPWRFGLDGGCTKAASWMNATCDQHGFHCLDSEQLDGCRCVDVRVNFLCYENKRGIAPTKSSKGVVIDGIIISVVTIVMLALALALMVFFIRRNSVQKHDYEKMLEKMANSVSEAAGDIGEPSPVN